MIVSTDSANPFLTGGGEMGQLIRTLDWSQTSLGPVSTWPQSLRTTLSIMLNAKLPMGLWWGADLIQFYNDAYRPCLGNEGKHPQALGQRGPECWPEVWPLLEPLIQQVLAGGEATWQEDLLIPIYRNGRTEQAYWTFSYSPVRDESGKIAGVMVLCQETTRQIEGLRLSGQRFENFVHQASVGIIVLRGEEMVVEVVNEAYGRLIDRGPEELLNQPLFSIIPEAKPYFHPILEKVRLSGEPLYLYDYPYFVLVNGAKKEGFLDLVYQPFKGPDGSISGVMVLCHEVTEKILARLKVEESEGKYRGLFETMDQGFCIVEMIFEEDNQPIDYHFLESNPVFEKQTGLKDVMGKTARELVPDLEAHWFEIYGRVALTGEPTRFIKRSAAMSRWFEVHAFRLGDSESRKVAILFTDITGQQEAEGALKESEERFRTLADNISQLAWMANGEGWIFWYNRRWYEYTGTSLEEMQGWGWEKVHHPEYIEQVVAFVQEAWQKAEPWELEFPLRKQDGEYRWFLTRAIPVKDEKGRVQRWLGTNTDISREKNYQQQLLEMNQKLTRNNEELKRINVDLDNFVYTASHDLKAPIANLEGLQWQLSKRLAGKVSAMEQEMMELMQEAITKLNRTVKDLSEIAKIQKEVGQQERLSFREILENVTVDLTPLIRETDAHLEVNLAVEHLHYPRKHLRSILYNLLSNALKYHSPDRTPRILIWTREEEGQVVLSVQDNGLGLDKEQQAKLFLMFKRLHTHVEGTGVGLYMVKRIVENNGGEITVESQPEKGTVFQVYFASAIELLEDISKSEL